MIVSLRLTNQLLLVRAEVHPCKKAGVCTDHGAVSCWPEARLGCDPEPASSRVLLQVSSGSRGRD